MPSMASSTLGRLRALTLTPLLCTQMNSGPSSRWGGTSPSRPSTWMKQAYSGKKMPEHTYITREKCAPGFKTYKDLFTLPLGANLTGDCKLKPVLVYHVENPCSLNPQAVGVKGTHLWAEGFQRYCKSFKISQKPFYSQVNDKEA